MVETTINDKGQIVVCCGCINEMDPISGVQHCVSKCDFHKYKRTRQQTGWNYYHELGCFEDGIPKTTKYCEELLEAVGPFKDVRSQVASDRLVLEIGCGASMYAGALINSGYTYHGIEPDPWAAEWTRETYWCRVSEAAFPAVSRFQHGMYSLILCAHALEHMPDVVAAVGEMNRLLRLGGELIIVVPNDDDPANPDHWWFFNEDTLRDLVSRHGFNITKLVKRKYIEREHFLYLRAVKEGEV